MTVDSDPSAKLRVCTARLQTKWELCRWPSLLTLLPDFRVADLVERVVQKIRGIHIRRVTARDPLSNFAHPGPSLPVLPACSCPDSPPRVCVLMTRHGWASNLGVERPHHGGPGRDLGRFLQCLSICAIGVETAFVLMLRRRARPAIGVAVLSAECPVRWGQPRRRRPVIGVATSASLTLIGGSHASAD